MKQKKDVPRAYLFAMEGFLQMIIGVGAVIAGLLLMISPEGKILHMPLDMLKRSPFSNFFIPGLILFLVNGLGNVAAGILSFGRHACSGYAGMVFGLGLMIWIFVQVSMIGGGHWLQYLYFGLGVLQLALGILMQEALRKT
jgi:hypothetical protein